MARKKKTEAVVEQLVTEEVLTESQDVTTVTSEDFNLNNFMNEPEEEIVETKIVKETKDENNDGQRPLKRVLKFTPVGLKVEYI